MMALDAGCDGIPMLLEWSQCEAAIEADDGWFEKLVHLVELKMFGGDPKVHNRDTK